MDPSRRPRIIKPVIGAKHLPILALGACMGGLALFLADRELRWTVFACIALLGLVFIAAMPAKQKILTAIFILSFQVDVYLRFFYGRAQSNEGLAIPLVVVAGAALILFFALEGRLRDFTWGGNMKIPIVALLLTTLVSLGTTSERFVGVSTLWYGLELYFVYWITFNITRSANDFRNIINLLLLILAVQSIIYFIQSALGITFNFMGETIEGGDVPRPGGTVSTNPAGFASFIMPALLITCALVTAKVRFQSRTHLFILMALGVAAVGLSFTRAAWIGFVLGFATIVLFGFRHRLIQAKMVVGISAVTMIGVLVLIPTMLTRISGDYAGSGIDPNKATLDERWGLMQVALNVISAHPLTGVGPGAYGYVLKGYTAGVADQWFYTVHNEFLLRAAETGIPGALAFVALLVAGFRVALKLARSKSSLISICALGWFAALIALIWQMNWVPWIGWSYNAMLWLMLGLMDGGLQVVKRQEVHPA